MSESRHHHYIPQAYLKGFALKKSEKSWVTHVTDIAADRFYNTNVRNVCGERDFMRFEMGGVKPDAIESGMAKFEAKCIEAVRRVARTRCFEGEDANWTLNLMALLAVRSPERRESIRDFHERLHRISLDLTLTSKERFDNLTARMLADGVSVNPDATYEDVKAFNLSDNYALTLNKEYHIDLEFEMMGIVLNLLRKRLWTLYIADGTCGNFITTNTPVTLTYNNEGKIPLAFYRSPGYALTNTTVFFPLTRHALLVGRWDKGGHTEGATPNFIAAVNTYLIGQCLGKVFSASPKMRYLDPFTFAVYHDEKFLERAKGWKIVSARESHERLGLTD